MAIPPTLAGRIRYSPPLPPLRDQLTQQVPMGYVTKVQIAYPEPFWRAEGLSGSVFSLDDEVSVIFDNSPHDLSCGVLLGFLEGAHARRAGKLAPEERRELVLSVFAKFFGPRAADPEEYVERDWAAEEWSRGCYGGRFGTGRVDGLRRGASRARGPHPLGGHGDGGGLERLHGRGHTLWRAGRPRSARLLRSPAHGTCRRRSEAYST